MTDYMRPQNLFSQEAVNKYLAQKNNKGFQFSQWARDFHQKHMEKEAEEAERYGTPQVGFGQTYTPTFNDDADDGSLDYNA